MNTPAHPIQTVTLAFTGASGMPYGMRLLECLLAAGCRVQLLYSQVAQVVARQEMALELPARASEAQAFFRERFAGLPGSLEVYGREEWFAPVASGSNAPDAMVVCPCSMGPLAAIAQGLAGIAPRALPAMRSGGSVPVGRPSMGQAISGGSSKPTTASEPGAPGGENQRRQIIATVKTQTLNHPSGQQRPHQVTGEIGRAHHSDLPGWHIFMGEPKRDERV